MFFLLSCVRCYKRPQRGPDNILLYSHMDSLRHYSQGDWQEKLQRISKATDSDICHIVTQENLISEKQLMTVNIKASMSPQ